MFPSLTREMGWPQRTCPNPPELLWGVTNTVRARRSRSGSGGAAGICCSLFQGTGDGPPK